MDCTNIEEAKEALFERENITAKDPKYKYIGSLLEITQTLAACECKKREFSYCDGLEISSEAEARESAQEKQWRLEERSWLEEWSKPQFEKWLQDKNLDGVVWTALPPQFDDQSYRVPSEVEVLRYLKRTRGPKQIHAKEYIQKAPPQIDTNYRRAIVAELGWECISRPVSAWRA